MQLIVKSVHEEGREIRSFNMMPEEATEAHGLLFMSGQVAILNISDLRPAYFAFASAPEDPQLQFLVKRSGDAAQVLYELVPGEHVRLAQVVGRGFQLENFYGKDLIFIAMGTGVAPLRSALRSALTKTNQFGRLMVLYGARTPDDFCYRQEVNDWKAAGVEIRQVISQPTGYEWSGSTGYVQSLLDNVLPELSSPVALVCGSREMMDQTRTRLQAMGFADDHILTNY